MLSTSGFTGDVMFSCHETNWRIKQDVMFRRSLPGGSTSWTSDDYSVWLSSSKCGTGVKSVIYDCLVISLHCIHTVILLKLEFDYITDAQQMEPELKRIAIDVSRIALSTLNASQLVTTVSPAKRLNQLRCHLGEGQTYVVIHY